MPAGRPAVAGWLLLLIWISRYPFGPIVSGNTSIEIVMPAREPRRLCRAFPRLAVERCVANDELLPTALSFKLDLADVSSGDPTDLEIVAEDDVNAPDFACAHL